MKRSAIRRKTPLKAGSGPARKPMQKGRRKVQKAANDCRWRSAEYLAFVRTLPCSLCNTSQGIAAHHLKHIWHMSGEGLKAPDSFVMPLCDGPGGCHAKVHNEPALWSAQPEWIKQTIRAALADGVPTETRDELVHALAFIDAREAR